LRRREKLFWLCAGAALIVLFLSIIPSHYEICEVAEKTKEKDCASYQVAQFLLIKIPQFLDVHNWLITALFAGLVTLFTWRLWQATNELRVSTDKLWDAGERQLAHGTKTAERQLRAYIFAHPAMLTVKLRHATGSIGKFTVRYETKNWGQTPAYRIRNAAFIRKLPSPLPDDFAIVPPIWKDQRNVSLGPGQSMFSDCSESYSLTKGEGYYIIGLIEYFDTFGHEKRTTKFCYTVDVEAFVAANAGGTSPGGSDVAFGIAQQHNEAD